MGAVLRTRSGFSCPSVAGGWQPDLLGGVFLVGGRTGRASNGGQMVLRRQGLLLRKRIEVVRDRLPWDVVI